MFRKLNGGEREGESDSCPPIIHCEKAKNLHTLFFI